MHYSSKMNKCQLNRHELYMLYFRCNCSLRRSLLYGTFHRRQEWLTIVKGTAMRTCSICESKKEIDTKVESGMKNFVITIGREFGSGGHNLGEVSGQRNWEFPVMTAI